MNPTFRHCARIILLTACLAVICGCQQPAVQSNAPPDSDAFNKVLVVAFRNMNAGVQDQRNVRCPLSGKMFVAGEVPPSAEAFLTETLMKHLPDRERFKLISAEELKGIQSSTLASGENIPEQRLLMETGRKLHADAVLAGHAYRFAQRVGGNYSVDSPASVAFDLHLLRVSDGRVIWNAVCDETQKPLTDNLFQINAFLKRDGKWTTAQEVAAMGMEEMMASFPIHIKRP